MMRAGMSAVAALIAMGSLGAEAQTEPGATQEHLARTFREQGVEAARAGDWNGARERFQRSYDLDPRVLTLYNLAAAELNSGSLVEADEHFRRFVRATQDGSHAQFHAEANRYREELSTRIARLTISITNLQPSDQVMMDDTELAVAALGAELPVNPGRHRIAVIRDGQVVGEDARVLGDGAAGRINLQLPEAVSVPAAPTARQTAEAAEANQVVADPVMSVATDSHRGRNIAIGVVVGLVVVAGLVVGGYFLLSDDAPDPYQGSLGTIDFR